MTKLALTVVLIIGAALGSFYLTHPKYEEWQEQLQENEVAELELQNLIEYIEGLDEKGEKIEKNKEYLGRVKMGIPKDHDAPSLFLYLQRAIEDSELENEGALGVFNEREHPNNPNIQEVVFSLSLAGDYEEIKGFLQEIERVIRIVSVDRMTLTGRGDGIETPHSMTVQLNVIAYSY